MEINQKHKRIFNYGLLITLIVFMALFLFLLKDFSREGITCQAQPFLYGARRIAADQENGHMFCSCSIYGEEGLSHYSFNEVEENPKHIIGNLSIEYNNSI